jgi:hypothetical protein
LNSTTFNVIQPRVEFATPTGDTAEVQFNLTAEPNSFPTPQTDG